MLVTSAQASRHERYGEGLAVDLDVPYERVLEAVQAVTENGAIQGTWQYRGASDLDGASPAKAAAGFKTWDGKGTALYKVRLDAIAPEHFYASGDQGTVSVRYVLEPAGLKQTHLRIDAIYQENDGHRSHPSDGQVENSEFAAITKQLEDMDEADKKQKQQEVIKEQQNRIDALLVQVQEEKAGLKASLAKQAELQQQVRDLQGVRLAHVRKAQAEVKSSPYNEARTIQSLSRGDAVRVLSQTSSWSRVETGDGRDGWIYSAMLDVTP